MSLAADIRSHYPHPVEESLATREGAYCIGGACIMFGDRRPILDYPNCDRFPHEYELANVLQQYNPALSDREAYEFACCITEHNDAGCFEEGWTALDLAMIRISK